MYWSCALSEACTRRFPRSLLTFIYCDQDVPGSEHILFPTSRCNPARQPAWHSCQQHMQTLLQAGQGPIAST
jgi:hypothetical protein